MFFLYSIAIILTIDEDTRSTIRLVFWACKYSLYRSTKFLNTLSLKQNMIHQVEEDLLNEKYKIKK